MEHGNNQFRMSFEAKEINQPLNFSITNMQGQMVIFNRVENTNGSYEFDFDMSYAPKGLYLLKLGRQSFGKIKKFMVD